MGIIIRTTIYWFLMKTEKPYFIRKAFVMKIYEGCEKEYEQRHSPIWRDLYKTLKEYGVHNYSIFFVESTKQLFGYVEIENEKDWEAISETDVCKRWWKYMSDIMPSNEDNSPITLKAREVFHID